MTLLTSMHVAGCNTISTAWRFLLAWKRAKKKWASVLHRLWDALFGNETGVWSCWRPLLEVDQENYHLAWFADLKMLSFSSWKHPLFPSVLSPSGIVHMCTSLVLVRGNWKGEVQVPSSCMALVQKNNAELVFERMASPSHQNPNNVISQFFPSKKVANCLVENLLK